MTAPELVNHLNNTYGIGKPWPLIFEVDSDTYANVCQSLFTYLSNHQYRGAIKLAIGPNDGVMFKGIELILKAKE